MWCILRFALYLRRMYLVYIARRRYALTSAYSDDDIDAIASDREEEEIEEEEGGEEGE